MIVIIYNNQGKGTMSSKQNEKDTVSFTVEDRIAWVRFNRPAKRNAQSPSLNRRMYEVISELEFLRRCRPAGAQRRRRCLVRWA